MRRPSIAPRVVLLAAVALAAAAVAATALVSVTDGDLIDTTSATTEPPPASSTTTTTEPPAVVASLPPAPPPTTTTTEPPPPPPPPPPSSAAPAPARPRAAAVEPAPPAQMSAADVTGPRCIVRLHGKGGGAGGTGTIGDGLLEVRPGGNAAGWNGRQWLYFPDGEYARARAAVVQAVDQAGCGPIVLYGFSNGAAFAAKLYCRGETFGGRLRGVVVDDPVVDHAVGGCRPAGGVRVALYWTGALEATAQPGWDCASQDWTCEGGTTIGIDAYQAALGVGRKQSPHSNHASYANPPELNAWW